MPNGRGRPFQVAVLARGTGAKGQMLEDFTRAMRSLTYREVTALAVAFGRHRDTVTKWRYLLQTPDPCTMLDIIDWHKRGKPTMTMHHTEKGVRA